MKTTMTRKTVTGKTITIKTVSAIPTTASEPKCYYRVVDSKGIYWGIYYVNVIWDGTKVVFDAAGWPEVQGV